MYEQQYVEPVGAVATLANGSRPQLLFGSTDAQPLLPVGGEVFGLRKLLPTSVEYDFNMHVMTFEPGEFLTVKEVHYNQHGLLLLDGHGIYRLADKWRVRAAAAGAALLARSLRVRVRQVPCQGGRRHLDGALRGAVVRRAGQDAVALHHQQGHEPRPAAGLSRVTQQCCTRVIYLSLNHASAARCSLSAGASRSAQPGNASTSANSAVVTTSASTACGPGACESCAVPKREMARPASRSPGSTEAAGIARSAAQRER
jgi:hypothetical protein